MTDLEKAARQMLEALEIVSSCVDAYYIPKGKQYVPEAEKAIAAGRRALEQQPAAQWRGLTTDEMKEVADRYHLKPPNVPVAFRAIEAKLREKNGGGV